LPIADRCTNELSLHPPPAALDFVAQSKRATNCATPRCLFYCFIDVLRSCFVRPVCGSRHRLRSLKTTCRSPTAAPTNSRFIRHRRRSISLPKASALPVATKALSAFASSLAIRQVAATRNGLLHPPQAACAVSPQLRHTPIYCPSIISNLLGKVKGYNQHTKNPLKTSGSFCRSHFK